MRILFLLALLSAAVAAPAKVYTWTDANGVVHYTDRPTAPQDATVLEDVETARQAELPAGPADAPPKVSATALQGTWCEYQVAADLAGTNAQPERILWTFSGDTLTYRDLDSGAVIESRFSVEGAQIVSDKAAMGKYSVRKFGDAEMELGGSSGYYRLRRGDC